MVKVENYSMKTSVKYQFNWKDRSLVREWKFIGNCWPKNVKTVAGLELDVCIYEYYVNYSQRQYGKSAW